ncbi:MAG: PilZ domain-containing protein [Beijerinckiaceae bacterium]
MQPLRQRARAPMERRRHARVPVSLLGRYMLEDRQEFPCQTKDMSPGGILLHAPFPGRVGERVVVYLDQLGRLEGRVTRTVSGGFAMTINATIRKRDKLASQLTWLANRHTLGLPEDRRHERIIPRNPVVTMRVGDTHEVICRLIDVSVSGAAMTCDIRMEKGLEVIVGSTPARIVRVTDGGIAVEFRVPLTPDRFHEGLIL